MDFTSAQKSSSNKIHKCTEYNLGNKIVPFKSVNSKIHDQNKK
jgi:hypothetical protein